MSELASIAKANRLVREKSPYLRQHARNPVDWFPWGDEAFAKARDEQKPIFLSIGYSTCHWCHVMARESFENEAIARALNRDFVPVKVDREERPDVDRVYMTYVQTTTGRGGWPMSVWLTPELKPFYGGTYFPPEDRAGGPGFATVLAALSQAWQEQREQLLTEGERVADALRSFAREAHPAKAGEDDLSAAAGQACNLCLRAFVESYDAAEGGFGGAPKFPRAPAFNFLLRAADILPREFRDSSLGDRDAAALSGRPFSPSAGTSVAVTMAVETLRKMAQGGIHDHVGGGFHRYSVDASWFVPHFEKMLYDQAQLAVNYLEAGQATGDEYFSSVARGILDYVLRDLAHPAGGFYSAEDADSEIPGSGDRRQESHEADPGSVALVGSPLDNGKSVPFSSSGARIREHAEGAFYLWTKEQIERALNDGVGAPLPFAESAAPSPGKVDAALFCAHFGVLAAGNVSKAQDFNGEFRGKNILRQRQSLAQTAQEFGIDPATAANRIDACLERLRETRAGRPRPNLDDKIITAWNGLMISAFAKGHQVLGTIDNLGGLRGRPVSPASPAGARYVAAAVSAAEFIHRELYDGQTGVLYRSWCNGRSNVPGFAEDYACMVQGLLDLYETTFDIRWLQWAGLLQTAMDAEFWDVELGGYFNSREQDRSIIARLKEDYDGAEPAPSSVAALNLLRLEAMIGNDADRDPHGLTRTDRAAKCLESFRAQWTAAPHGLPQMLCALAWIQISPSSVVIAGDPVTHDFRELAAVVQEKHAPGQVLLAADQGQGQAWLAGRLPWLAEMKPLNGRATAYVCQHSVCQEPVTDRAALRRIIWNLQ